jgi:hypothetical protein
LKLGQTCIAYTQVWKRCRRALRRGALGTLMEGEIYSDEE